MEKIKNNIYNNNINKNKNPNSLNIQKELPPFAK